VTTEAAAAAVARGTAVIAVGGDGSLNTVAQAAHAAGYAIGVIPYGAFNYFARSHGIPTEPAAALRPLLDARPMPVQVAAINDRVFLVIASLGVYPELLQDRREVVVTFDGEVALMRAPIDIRVLDKPLYLLQATGAAGSADAPEAVP